VTAADGTKTRPPGVNDGRTDTRARPGWKALLFNTSHDGPGERAGLGTVPGTTNAGTRDWFQPHLAVPEELGQRAENPGAAAFAAQRQRAHFGERARDQPRPFTQATSSPK